MKDREKWRLIVEEAKAHPGLLSREEGRNIININCIDAEMKVVIFN